MIHYNVYFTFKAGCDDATELPKVRAFLDLLKSLGKLHDYRLLKNRGTRPKSRLSSYQAIAQFKDGEQFGLPFAFVAETGVHSGKHGAMIENVDEFIVEVFEEMPA